jgi:septum formation topological specificity factor MinE
MKINSTTTYSYSAREILDLIKKDLKVPGDSISFTFSPDGTYKIIVNNDKIPPQDNYDPYDAYRDQYGRLPSDMW